MAAAEASAEEPASPSGALRSAWRHREFRYLITSFGISGSGDFLYSVALFAYLLDHTASPGWVAAAATLRVLPSVVFGPLGGVIATRYDHRSVMVACDLVRAVLMALLAAVAVVDGPAAAVIAISFLAAAASTPFRPAVVATTPLVVGEDDLAAANAAEGVVGQLCWFIGPALGALLLRAGSPEAAFALNGLTFLASALLLVRVRSASSPANTSADSPDDGPSSGRWAEQLAAGWRAIRSSRDLILLNGLVLMVLLVFGFELVLYVLVAEGRLGLGSEGSGYLYAAIGVGGLLVSPFTGRIAAGDRPGLALAISAFLLGAPMALLSVVSESAVAFALLLFEGAGNILFEVLAITLLQRLVAGELMARVFSVQDSLGAAAMLGGSALAPALVAVIGLQTTLAIVGGTLVVFSVLAGPAVVGMGASSLKRSNELEPRVAVLRHLGLFAGAPQAALERLAADVIEQSAIPEGTVLIVEGDEPDDLYVVREGIFHVVSHGEAGGGERLVNVIGPGGWFGEIGLVARVPRTGTVTAFTEACVWRISGQTFIRALVTAGTTQDLLQGGIAGRLAGSHPSLAKRSRTPGTGTGGHRATEPPSDDQDGQ